MMTVKEVAERLGISPALVYALCSVGRLKHERHGLGRGTIRVSEEALAEYRRGQEVEVKREAAPQPPPVMTRLKRLGV